MHSNRSAPLRTLLPLAGAAALLVAAAGVARAEEAPRPAKPFSHKQHLDEGLACKGCHDLKQDKAPVVERRCFKCHEGEAPAYTFDARTPEPDVPFPHRRHSDALDCALCHGGLAQDQAAPKLTYESCQSCHQERKVTLAGGGCASCHGKDMRRALPPTHDGNWPRAHAQAARWEAVAGHGESCELCHGQSACQRCHAERLPRDHNGLWRVRTHGGAAFMDRDRCKTCHETGTCVRCHRSQPPMNHSAAWIQRHGVVASTTADSRCGVCHSTGFCQRCHSGR